MTWLAAKVLWGSRVRGAKTTIFSLLAKIWSVCSVGSLFFEMASAVQKRHKDLRETYSGNM